jgi:hypothetical protein
MTPRRFAILVGTVVLGVTLFIPNRATAQTFVPADQQPGSVKPIDMISKVVKPGDTVSVVQTDGTKIFGKVEIVSPAGLTLLAEGLRLQVALDAIGQIDKHHRHPVRGLWIGTLIGAGVGLALGSGNTGSEDYSGPLAVFGAIFGAGIGTIVGTVDQGGSTVYVAPPTKPGIVITPRGAAIHLGFRF